MPARNPFEALLVSTGPELDIERAPPRDLMADAFLSQMFERLAEADRAGFVPGYPFYGYGHRHMHEMNGLPVRQGFEGIHNTFDRHPFPTQHLGNHGGAVPPTHAGGIRVTDYFPQTSVSASVSDMRDPFEAAELGNDPDLASPEMQEADAIARAMFEQDLTPFSGPDATTEPLSTGGTPPPLNMGNSQINPFGSDPNFLGNTTGALGELVRTVRPGMASLNTLGYQPQPGMVDPYGQDLRNYLRKLLRAV